MIAVPTVTVIIPLFNKEPYILATIQSLLKQDFQHWELLIIDNGSTDGSLEKTREIKDLRVQCLTTSLRGPGVARNVGIELAKGRWIQFLDADDLLEPNHLSQMLEVANSQPLADVVACGWKEFVDGSSPHQNVVKRPAGEGTKPLALLKDSAIASPPWAVHAALVKRSVLSKEYYWPTELDQYLAEDIFFWFKLVNHCSVVYCDSASALYRIQTFGGRAEGSYSRKWFEGVQIAIEHNLAFLQNRKQPYSVGQCEQLMRIYLKLFQLSKKNGFTDLSSGLYQKAEQWFTAYLDRSNTFKISMFLRKLLGLRLFADSQSYLLSLKRANQ